MSLLKIENLKVNINGNQIIKGINLEVNAGEIHAIMGPNGSGKSTLANVLAGREDYIVTEGSVTYMGKNLFDMASEVRAREGIFLAFQYPVEIPGVSNANFMRTALNELRKFRNEEPLDAMDFLQLMREKAKLVEIDKTFLNRSVNEGFSGGEKKRMEVLQLMMLKPHFAILDEIDSGLDIDGLKCIAQALNELVRTQKMGVVLITHGPSLLKTITPHFVHIMSRGRVVTTGGEELARDIAEHGYAQFTTI
ncbi:MAG TPA: Fe-S cluster assembly ATPase SufC [Candidatus Magasanikbacteria bacterium]|nr:Fe-S cluster assembly ATPase SufC [Candidatus Magasanikbacteria bacterium]